jgi:hypothetical protein
MTTALLLCSGGLDSTTLAYWLIERDVQLAFIFLDYGQHCVEKEWETLNQDCRPRAICRPSESTYLASFAARNHGLSSSRTSGANQSRTKTSTYPSVLCCFSRLAPLALRHADLSMCIVVLLTAIMPRKLTAQQPS